MPLRRRPRALRFALGVEVGGLLCRERRGRLIAFAGGAHRRVATGLELLPRRLLPRIERADFGLDLGGCCRQLLDLLTIERDLLLQPADLHLARVRRFARCRRLAVRLRQLEAQSLERGLELGEPARPPPSPARARPRAPSGRPRSPGRARR